MPSQSASAVVSPEESIAAQQQPQRRHELEEPHRGRGDSRSRVRPHERHPPQQLPGHGQAQAPSAQQPREQPHGGEAPAPDMLRALDGTVDEWSHLRAAHRTPSPEDILGLQSRPDWRPRSNQNTYEFTFCSTKQTDKEKLWEALRYAEALHLAHAAAADVEALQAEMTWDDDALECTVPGLLAASRVLLRLLRHEAGLAMTSVQREHRDAATRGQLRGRRHRATPPTLASSAYGGPSRKVNPATSAQQPLDHSLLGCQGHIDIGGISCGRSGGADINGSKILQQRWLDLAVVWEALGVNVFIGTGCRLLPGADLVEAVPGWSCQALGPRSNEFDSVCIFAKPGSTPLFNLVPMPLASSRITWAQLSVSVHVGGFYVPPLNANHTEAERESVLMLVFEQYDHLAMRGSGEDLAIVVYGDLNPSPRLLALYLSQLRLRGLSDLIPAGTPTRKGSHLDFAFSNRPDCVRGTVHNGMSCKEDIGCTRSHCGNLREVLGSDDLDHDPCVLTCPIGTGSNGGPKQLWRTKYSHDVEEWQIALSTLADPICSLISDELESSASKPEHWQGKPVHLLRQAVSLASWLWRTISLFTAMRAGLIVAKRVGGPRDVRLALCSGGRLTVAYVDTCRHALRKSMQKLSAVRPRQYFEKLTADDGSVDRYLSSFLREPSDGLPEILRDDESDMVLSGTERVLEAAARYIEARGEGREELPNADSAHTAAIRARRRHILAQFRSQWPDETQHVAYTWDELDKADAKLNKKSTTADLPYACLGRGRGGHRRLRLAVQNFVRFCGVVVPRWLRQPTYHKHKPGRSRVHLHGYRILGICRLELRSAEALWSSRNEHKIWQYAGAAQMGQMDPLVSVLLDVEVALIRSSLGLPHGTAFVDGEEAFDTMPPECISVRLHDEIDVTGEDHILGDGLLHNPEYIVVKGELAAWPARPVVGVPEGRGLGPAFFAAGASEYSSAMREQHVGVGLGPPSEAVLAYIVCSDGTDDPEPDTELASQLHAEVSSCALTWAEAMEIAGNDSTRLRMLDLSSRTQVAFKQFLDDSSTHGSSWGALAASMRVYMAAMGKLRATAKHGKNKTGFHSFGLFASMSIACGSGTAPCVTSRMCLGIPLESSLTFSLLLSQVESRSRAGLLKVLCALDLAGMPLHAILHSLNRRVLPKSPFGSELLMLRPDMAERMNALQDSLLRMVLDLQFRVPRALLLLELGVPRRLHMEVWPRAFSLEARTELLDESHICRSTMTAAAAHRNTWAALIARERVRLDMPSIRDWAGRGDPLTRAARKRIAKQYCQEVVKPIVDASEKAWLQGELVRHPARGMGIVADLLTEPVPLQCLRGWAQLRLQGQFTNRAEGYARARECAACGEAAPPAASHLLGSCVAMRLPLSAAVSDTPWALLPRRAIAERFEAPQSADDILRMVRVCGRLQAAFAARCRESTDD